MLWNRRNLPSPLTRTSCPLGKCTEPAFWWVTGKLVQHPTPLCINFVESGRWKQVKCSCNTCGLLSLGFPSQCINSCWVLPLRGHLVSVSASASVGKPFDCSVLSLLSPICICSFFFSHSLSSLKIGPSFVSSISVLCLFMKADLLLNISKFPSTEQGNINTLKPNMAVGSCCAVTGAPLLQYS